MADASDYAVVKNALTAALQKDIQQMVPMWAQGMIPANEASILADQLSKIAIDTLDKHRQAKTA